MQDNDSKKIIQVNAENLDKPLPVSGVTLWSIDFEEENNFVTGIFTGLEILGVSLYVTFTELALMYYKDKKLTKKQTRFNKFREISA